MLNPSAPVKLTDAPIRIPLEEFISQYLGRRWQVNTCQDLADYACHPAALLSDGVYAVFAKFSSAHNGLEQFEIELASLRMLARQAGILIPTPVGIVSAKGGNILVLEEIQAIERTSLHWRQIGQTLARLHKVKSSQFGLETHGYFGPLFQDNTFSDHWPEFYAERRLIPGLKLAVDSGNLPLSFIKPLEQIIARLPDLCGDEASPSLLHGDAQQNNFICSDKGVFVIDPAVYFGNPEMDLAYIDYFQPVPDDVFDGYCDEGCIDPGFWERRDLWRIWGYLAAVTVEGSGYLDSLNRAIKKYI